MEPPRPAAEVPGNQSHVQRIIRRLRSAIPGREALAEHRLLRPVARHMRSPRLWHLQHEAVARAVGIGLFWALASPLAQIPLAAAHSIWWRANIPVAVAMTLVSNPFTFAFWVWLAYGAGTLLVDAPPLVMPGRGTNLREWLMNVGEPVLLGMAMLAIGGSLAGYVIVKLGWRFHVVWKRQRRLKKSASTTINP